ncbi:MAG: hypothetical protein ACM3XZ_09500 [Betaproteobacteria bacterium]
MRRFFSAALAVVVVMLASGPAIMAGPHMDLVWDFYNEAPSSSFARYHLVTAGYTSPTRGDLSVMWDWFDWTQGADNKHALTPWAIIYTYQCSGASPEKTGRRSLQAGYWIVSDIVDQLADPVILRQARATYTVERAVDSRTKLAWSAALYTPGKLSDLSLSGAATLTRSLGRSEISLGVNDLSTLDSMLFNAGRTPVRLGLRVPWSAGTVMHAEVIRMIGPEPKSMPSEWVRSKTSVIYRLGFDFKMW